MKQEEYNLKKFFGLISLCIFLFSGCVEQKLTVTFDPNGAAGQAFTQTVGTGDILFFPDNPFSYDGFSFSGWSSDRSGSRLYQPQETLNLSSDTVFYAVWQPLPVYTVCFDPQGGTGTMNPVTGTPGSEIRLPKCPFVKDGAPFYGWATEPGGEKVAGDEAVWILTEKETTLYALYMKPGIEYVTVTFHAQNGTGFTKQQNLVRGEVSTLDENSFTYEGYAFKGWATVSGSASVTYLNGAALTLSADLNLYAVWEKNEEVPPPPAETGVLTFNANGGNGTMEPVTGLTDGTSFPLPKCTFTKEGSVFIGWAFTGNSVSPDFQDQSSFYTYYRGSSTLYAVWAEKNAAIRIAFDANGGNGTKNPIYVKPGEKFQMPVNDFTPPADKPYYTCNSYGTLKSPDTVSTYKFSGTYSFNEDTTLYAFWTPPADPSIGGASEKYKGQTVFSEGVNIRPEDWVQVSTVPEKHFAEWNVGCGWYDTSQDWLKFCWSATASNAIHWWLDRNADYVDRYYRLNNQTKPDFSYSGKGISAVFAIFTSKWQANIGGNANIGFNWFVNIDDNNSVQESARGKGGYFKEVFNEHILTEVLNSPNRRSFNTFIAKALENGKLITMSERNMSGGHAITCWGFEFDESGYICALYYTDSATSWNNTQTNRDLSLGRITVKYDDTNWKPYMQTETLINGEVQYGRVEIIDLQSYSQGTEYWEAYFASRPGN